MSGRSSCARSEAVDSKDVKAEVKTIASSSFSYGGSYETRFSTTEVALRPDQCFFETVTENNLELQEKAEEGAPINQQLKVSPNVIGESGAKLQLDLNVVEEGQVTVRIYDAFGKEIQTEQLWAMKGENRWELATAASLAPGMYVLTLTDAQRQQLGTVKLIKP